VPSGPIYSIDQMFADAQVRHVGMAQPVKTKNGQALTLVGQPVSLSRTPSKLAAPPPGLGQHTDAGAQGIRIQRQADCGVATSQCDLSRALLGSASISTNPDSRTNP